MDYLSPFFLQFEICYLKSYTKIYLSIINMSIIRNLLYIIIHLYGVLPIIIKLWIMVKHVYNKEFIIHNSLFIWSLTYNH